MNTPHRGRDALIGIGYLVVIAALIALSIAVYDHVFSDQLVVRAEVSSAGSSLQDGSDVMVRGILVGQVDGVTTSGRGADLHLLLNPGAVRSLPANMMVQLLPKTLFGERFVNLVYPAYPSGRLGPGDIVHEDTSAQTVELEQLFTDLEQALTAVQPQKLSATLGELSDALRGRGRDLGDTLALLGRYLDGLAPEIPQLAGDLDRLADVARTYTAATPDLLAGLQSFTTTGAVLVRQRQDYVNLLAALTRTGSTFGSFVGTTETQIIGLAADARPSLQVTARYASEFPCVTAALVDLVPRVDKAFGAGTQRPGARVRLSVTSAVPAYRAPSAPFPGANSTAGPRCPYVPTTALGETALADVQGIPGADTVTQRTDTDTAGLGSANSPQENELIAEIMAPRSGMTPARYPRWASLLLGPALRGTTVRAP